MPALAEPSAVAYPTVTVEVDACPAVPLRSTGTSTEPAEASTVAARAFELGRAAARGVAHDVDHTLGPHNGRARWARTG